MAKPLAPPIIFHDGRYLYLEWSGYVQRFEYTEGGLAKALKTIPHIASQPGYLTGQGNIADKLLDNRKIKVARKTIADRTVAKATEGMRRSASEAIRRMRMKANG